MREPTERTERPATTHIRCPKCKSNDLELSEVGEVSLTWHVFGGSFDRAAGWRDYGGAMYVIGDCKKCEHRWRLRGALQITDVCKEAGEQDDSPTPPGNEGERNG